ncbi:unnamed protein product [Phyllotreta striolata]|uniref:F-actin monooxygenase n=1 Tax=Phyllotreta striolata TaxID=444603 RepID=A0A9N9TED8_PHYSR|nr:unnamed protein product [Phyllotreta striolata]
MDYGKPAGQAAVAATAVVDAAHANEYFELFVNASSMKHILGYYRGLIDCLHIRPNVFNAFYPKLKANLTSWRAKALLKKFDTRASHKCYMKGKAASNTRVLVIGGGPCGMRTAIEAQLLGAKVVVVEKRDRYSRNNVLHLWPFVIEDLRMLGAKKFFGKFCAGAIDHISIRQLQCILLKCALLLGVEVHTEVGFASLIEPEADTKIGWRAEFKPSNHPVSQYEFDVIIGADGKRNTLQGFSRKEFRGKLAIAITANFINKKTEAEASVEEISGVAFIFNQKFFKDLQEATRIDLENIVYYKDDTHYFVMTAKKHSLIEKGVIKQDFSDTERLLAPENVDKEALQNYAIEAANFSTNYQMPNLEFAVNHYGQPDVAMFDFTSMYAAENASKVLERNGYRLLNILVGDSLLEPFWPTGSGCARGFLSSLDAAWAIRSWSMGTASPLETLAERESIYRLLAQTTPDNLNKDWKSYTLDPATRYPNLNKAVVLPHQVACLYDTDNPANVERMKRNYNEKPGDVPKKRRRGNVDNEILLNWLKDQLKDKEDVVVTDMASVFKDGKVLCAIIHHYRPDLLDYSAISQNDPARNNQIAVDILEKELCIPPVMTGTELSVTEDYLTMATYLTEIYHSFRGEIPFIKHPKLELPPGSTKMSEVSFKTIKTTAQHHQMTAQPSAPSARHRHKYPDAIAQKLASIDRKPRKRRTLEKIGASVDHDSKHYQGSRAGGRDEDIAAKIKHLESKWRQPQPVDKKPRDLLRAIGKIETSDWNIKEIEKKILENKMGKPSKAVDKEKVPKWSKEEFLARQTKMEKKHLDRQESSEAKFADIDRNIKNLDQKLKEGTARELGTNKVASITEKLVSKIPPEPKPPEKHPSRPSKVLPKQSASEFCHFCNKRVYLMEKLSAEGRFFHHGCFKCQYCHVQLRLGSYAFDRDGLYGNKFFCLQHFGMAGEIPVAKITRKPSVKRSAENRRSPEKKINVGAARSDSTDKVQTPERIEFSNLSSGHISSDQEDSLNQMDEDEWTDKNFGGSCAEFDTDDDSSSMSDSDSDDADAFGDALEEPVTKEGTLKWAERWKNSYRRNSDSNENLSSSSSDQSSYYDSSDDDESETATEGEEEIRARELRKQEVCVEPPIVHTDTGTDTEVVSDESSSAKSKEAYNSVTEISTDSEFAQDEPTPTRELPSILLNDFYVTKTRGSGPKRIQVKSRYLEQSDTKTKKPNIELKLTPLVPSAQPAIKKPAPIALSRPEGYTLNRTQSTGGIAAKVSLELKKKYLLGEPTSGGIQKSGSVSTLDTKFKSFHTNISDCQKMLKPSTEISASMQTFCKKLNELQSPSIVTKNIEDEKVEEPLEESKEDENESEGRPRSPLHETFIVVPQFDWSKRNDSLTSDSLASSDEDKKKKAFDNIPTIEIFKAQENEPPKEEFIPDSLQYFEEAAEPPKSITAEKKSLNQPKTLPNLENLLPEIHNSLHVKYKDAGAAEKAPPEAVASSPESLAEPLTAALTETELSDWARDEVVSDDFEEGELDEDFKRSPQGGFAEDKVILTESMQNVLSMNLDNIEFMDTGTETSSDDGIANSQNGYVLFKNEDEYAADSLSSNAVVEARNAYVGTAKTCDVANKPAELITVNNEQISSNCDGSLSVCISDKVTEEVSDKSKLTIHSSEADENSAVIESGTTTEENTLTDSTVKNVTECYNEHLILSQNNNINKIDTEEKENNIDANVEFHEHVQRLQSKVEFSNAKDSIDIRKTRRKSKPDVLQKPDLITEEIPSPLASPKYTPILHSPDILYNKEVIKKERDLNQKLIQEMVMNKMRAENKSLERRKRNKTTSMNPNLVLSKSPCNPVVDGRTQKKPTPPPVNQKIVSADFINAESKPNYKKRDKDSLFLNKDQSKEYRNRRCTVGDFIVPPKQQDSLPLKAKSIPNFQQKMSAVQSIDVDRSVLKAYNSDPNILETVKDKGKRKSPEKKGFAQFISGIFSKKSPTGSKGLFSKLSPKSKKISKSCTNLGYRKENEVISQKKSMSEYSINRNVTPPPVPPLPINYVRKTDESSDAEDEFKKQNNSSCDTLDCTGASTGSAAGRRSSSKSQRAIRQTQLKRHRMAQEIQRKLEETEVKTRELEERGVRVEKALRGEGSPDSSKDEAELFQEWFDLMRDRTELRRYERELTVRAQELELEDRHARLQHDLRDRLSSDKPKNVDDIKVEESIIEEMIDIVQKRDSLVAEIEEDKKRYSCEYRDLEEQMLAKGLILSSYKKSPQH